MVQTSPGPHPVSNSVGIRVLPVGMQWPRGEFYHLLNSELRIRRKPILLYMPARPGQGCIGVVFMKLSLKKAVDYHIPKVDPC